MTAVLPRNLRTAPKPKGVVEAPPDPMPVPEGDPSPVPPKAASSVRPPPAPPRRADRPARAAGGFLRTMQLTAGVAVVLAASVAVAWGARRYLVSSPRFGVRTVLVDGVHRRTAEQVAGAGGIAVGKNIFGIDLDAASAAIRTDPWIERAAVTRELPSTIRIAVVEREAHAIVSIAGDLYLATRDGDPFKKIGESDPMDLPVVTGILPDEVARDRAGVVLTVRRVLDVAEEMERVGLSKRHPLQEVRVERDGSLVATIGKEAILLSLGQGPYKGKIEQAVRVLNEVARRKANASVIFLDNDANPERVVVRMR